MYKGAVDGEVLALQCSAARRIQAAWRRRYANVHAFFAEAAAVSNAVSVEAVSENVSSRHDPFQTPGGNLQDVAFDPAAQPQAGHDYEQSVGETLDLRLWQPAHGDLFEASDSALYGELHAEAAIILQR